MRSPENETHEGSPDQETISFYLDTLDLLDEAGVSHLVGGAYALIHFTGIERHTKDIDLFIHPRDRDRALEVLGEAGYETEVTFPVWLAKARKGEHLIDLIYNSRNELTEVDELWFRHAPEGRVLGRPARLCPAEEIIWSKAFIMERERFDGADVAHLIHARGLELDWDRLMMRFAPHWRVLLSHLVLFGFIYPHDRHRIPEGVMEEMMRRLTKEGCVSEEGEPLCFGPILSQSQYRVDVERWGYASAYTPPPPAGDPSD